MTLRVLALCGFTQNAHIYSKQLGAIRKTCKEVEFVFLEPPIVVEAADMPWNQSLSEYDSSATTAKEEQTPETTPRAWWLTAKERTEYRRFEETITYLHEYLTSHPPFDGIMGFSQGGCMAAILAALLCKPNLHPLFPPHESLQAPKFLIAVGGFLPVPKKPDLSYLFPLPASLKTLHIIGRNDIVVTEEKSLTLVKASEESRLEYHDGDKLRSGHFTPSKASWRHFFNAYITSFAPGGSQGDIPPPITFGPSGTGTNTPASASKPATPRAGSPAAKDIPTEGKPNSSL